MEILEKYLIKSVGNSRILFIADLHLGYDEEYRRRGLFLPFESSRPLLDMLLDVIERERITKLVILGDFIHSFPHFRNMKKLHPFSNFIRTPQYSRWLSSEVRNFFEMLDEIKVEAHLVSGNHDIMFREVTMAGLHVHDSRGHLFRMNRDRLIGCAHGHVFPLNLQEASEVFLGHLHPAVALLDDNHISHRFPVFLHGQLSGREWLEILMKADVNDHERPLSPEAHSFHASRTVHLTIMPAANPYMIGTPLNMSRSGSGDEKKGKFYDYLLKLMDFDVFLIDHTYLGTLRDLREMYVEQMKIARR